MYHDPNLNRIGLPREVTVAGGSPPKGPGRPASGEAEFGFGDLIDLVNPLHHIPGVSTVYRHLTGDEIQGHVRVAGGALWGGPLGFLAGVVSAASEEASGRDPGAHMLAAVLGEEAVARHAPERLQEEIHLAEAAETPGEEPADAQAEGAEPAETEEVPSDVEALTGAEAFAALARDLSGQDSAEGPAVPETSTARAPSATGIGPGDRAFPIRAEHYAALPPTYAQAGHNYSGALERGRVTATPGGLAPELDRREAAGPSEAEMERELLAARREEPREGPAPSAAYSEPRGLPQGDFATRMMEALDRYRAMGLSQTRRGGQSQVGQAFDTAF